MTDQETILGLLRLGWSARRVARETGHRRETIARYGIAAGLIKPKPASKTKVATDLPPTSQVRNLGATATSEDQASMQTSRSNCEPHRAYIDAEIAKGRNAVAIYQDLVEHHGYVGAYNAVKRFVGKSRASEPKIFCRFETAPGQEAQVDYGEGAPTLDLRTGKYRKPRLFIMTLGCSRHAFRKVVWKSSSQIWCELHEVLAAV